MFTYSDMYENEYEMFSIRRWFCIKWKLGEIWDGLYENIPKIGKYYIFQIQEK